MSSRIPENFDKKFAMSDIAVRASNIPGSPLYASRMILSIFSRKFEDIFFKNNYDSITLDASYSAIKTVLRILHNVDRTLVPGAYESYSVDQLEELYLFADKFDIPLLKKLVEWHLIEKRSPEALKLANRLNLERAKEQLVQRIEVVHLQSYMSDNCDSDSMNMQCVKTIRNHLLNSRVYVNNETNHYENIRGCPKDFTEKWPMSDVVFRTRNSKGRDLHASRIMLSIYSPYFEALFTKSDMKNAEFLELDADFEIVELMLRVIHHCNRNFTFGEDQLDTEKLCKLYTFAEQFDFELLGTLVEGVLDSKRTSEVVHTAAITGNHTLKRKLIPLVDTEDVKKFFLRALEEEDEELRYSAADIGRILHSITTHQQF